MAQNQWALDAVGPGTDFHNGKTFTGLHLKVTSPASDCVVALETSEDGTDWVAQDSVTGPHWAATAKHFSTQWVRPNVVSLGTGAPPLSAVVTW